MFAHPVRACLTLALLSAMLAAVTALSMPHLGPPAGERGVTLRVETRRGSEWQFAGGSPTSLPLQRSLRELPAGLEAAPYRMEWRGTFLALTSGVHELHVASDDGARLWLDERLVVDNGGLHPRQWRSGVVHLDAGPHTFRLEYEQWGGDRHLETWLRQPGGLSRRLDAIATQFAPGPITARQRLTRTLRQALPWLATGSASASYLCLLVAAGLALFRRVEREASLPPADWRLAACLGAALVPIVFAITWGLPTDSEGWAPDEVVPWRLAAAMDQRFGAPWSSIYPPLHFLLLTPLALGVDAAAASDGWSLLTYPGGYVLHVGMRAVSSLMSLGCLAWLYVIVRTAGTAAQGRAAVIAGAACSTLLYYGKTANVDVPYLYWTLGACACVAAVGHRWSPRLVVLASALGACAIGTKDQAAGFLLLMPVWLLVLRWRTLAHLPRSARWRALVTDRAWPAATLAAALALTVIYRWPWDWTGPARHLEAARRGTYAAMVPGTLMGQLHLLQLNLELLVFMLGVPLACASAAGLLWLRRHLPTVAVAIVVPIAAYLLLFLPFIRYTYDRFLLGIALLLACAAGPFCLWLWEQRQRHPLALVGLAVVGLYTPGHALTANVQMSRDSRYAVEADLQARGARQRERIGLLSPRRYLPRPDLLPVVDLQMTVDDVRAWEPDVLLFEHAYLHRVDPYAPERAPLRQAIEHGTLGYRPTRAWQTPVPWWAFQAHPWVSRRYTRLGLSNLDKINPRIELWTR